MSTATVANHRAPFDATAVTQPWLEASDLFLSALFFFTFFYLQQMDSFGLQ
jgi:hypothetical protein